MIEDTKYNGWSSRESWLVSLWFGNEEGSWSWWDERAREVVEDVMESWEPDYEWETREDEARNRLANEMEEWVGELVVEKLSEASLLTDLLGGAIGRIDWREVAENWLEEIEKPEGWLTDGQAEEEAKDETVAD